MSLVAGQRVGAWVVEGPAHPNAPADLGPWLAHRNDAPWRRVELRPLVGDPTETAARIDALIALEPPHLERLVGLDEAAGRWFVVAERRHGTTLAEVARAEGPSRSLALSVGLATTQGLWFAHQHGVAHGGVRAADIWLSEDGRVRLTGWFGTETPTLAGDRAALAELLRWLFAGVRPALPSVDAWVEGTLDNPAAASLNELRRTLSQLSEGFLAATPHATPPQVDSTYFDERDEEVPTGPRAPHQIGRYVVIREIGRGGSGIVYEAVDPDLQRRVAVKVLLAGDFAKSRDQQRFLNEARAVAQLDHPNIVQILEFARHEGRPWYAMELVEGPNLLQVIREQGRLPWRTAVRLAASLAHALHHAHDQGLVHRDVKPNNVLLESDREPRLTDFGLALFTDDGSQGRLTRTGQVLGTPSYMSPEQANGELERIGPATDVYGVGVVLYEALTGRVPFEGDRPLSIIAAVVEGHPTPPRQIASGIPRQVEATCLKAMQVDIDDRYATAADLAEDLERCLRGEPILATPPTLTDHARWFVRRNRAQLGIVVTAIGVALIIVLASTLVLGARSVRQTNLAEAEAEAALSSVKARIGELEDDGRLTDADESWQAFARQPAHRGTRALVEGWWWRAERLAAMGDEDGQVGALGMAYAAAERRRDQERALLRLADQVRTNGDIGRLPRIVTTLDRRAPRLARTDDIRTLWRDALASERRLADAAELAIGPERSALLALSRATRTDHRATRAEPWTGPEAAFVLWGERPPVLVGPTPTLPALRRLDGLAWSPDQAVIATERRGEYWVGEDVEVVLTALRGPRPVRRRAYAGGPLRAATLVSDDRGASVTPVLALGDRLVEPASSGNALRDLHLATSGAESSVNDVVVADLDGDGSAEIATAVGEWEAYDVRIFERVNRTATLVARQKLGVVADLAVLPQPDGGATLIAAKVDRAPNPELFGAEQPYGEPPGLWKLDLSRSGGRAELQAERIGDRTCDGLRVGDVDGDGDADLVGQCGAELGLWIQDGDRLVALLVRDLRLLGIANLDDDRAVEVVVSDPHDGSRVWVLGTSGPPLPPLRSETWVAAPPPKRASDAFRESWQRAEELAFIGQLGQAADAMEQLAELNWGGPLGWAATLRAATLHDLAGRPVHAGELALRAADALEGLEQVAALRAAARAWQDAREVAAELAVLEQLRDLGALDRRDVVRLDQLQARVGRPSLDLDLLADLDDLWHVDQPLAVLHEPGSGLAVEAFGNQTLAHVPVRWDGEGLELDVTLAVAAVEWDGGLQIGLVPAGTEAPFYGLEVLGEAGPSGVQPVLRCRAGGAAQATPLPADAVRTARFQLFEDSRGFGCSFAGEDGFRTASDQPTPVLGFGRWDLVIRATGAPDTVARATLSRVRVSGAEVDAAVPSGDPARLAFANGRTSEASDRLAKGEPDPLLAVAIAAARGDGEALRVAIESANDLPTDLVLAHLLHCRLDVLGPNLQRLLGDDFPWWFAQAWHTALSRSRPEPELAEALLSALDGIEDDRLSTAADRAAWVRLGARRATAALALGDLPRASRAIEATLRWFERLRSEDRADAEVSALRWTIATLYLDRAALALLEGHPPAAALRAVGEALRWAPDPLSLLDRAVARDDLAPIRDASSMKQWSTALLAGQSVGSP